MLAPAAGRGDSAPGAEIARLPVQSLFAAGRCGGAARQIQSRTFPYGTSARSDALGKGGKGSAAAFGHRGGGSVSGGGVFKQRKLPTPH